MKEQSDEIAMVTKLSTRNNYVLEKIDMTLSDDTSIKWHFVFGQLSK